MIINCQCSLFNDSSSRSLNTPNCRDVTKIAVQVHRCVSKLLIRRGGLRNRVGLFSLFYPSSPAFSRSSSIDPPLRRCSSQGDARKNSQVRRSAWTCLHRFATRARKSRLCVCLMREKRDEYCIIHIGHVFGYFFALMYHSCGSAGPPA